MGAGKTTSMSGPAAALTKGKMMTEEPEGADGAVGLDAIPDNELPGMWERADFEGGQDEVRDHNWEAKGKMMSEPDELRKDAERYRWLRDHPDGFQSAAASLARPMSAEEGRMWSEEHPWGGTPKSYPHALDVVIDAARSAGLAAEKPSLPEDEPSAEEWKRMALLRGKMIDDLLAQAAQKRLCEGKER